MGENEAWRHAAQSRYWGEDEARAVVDAWQRSGDSLAGFCRANGLAAPRVSRWVARLERAEPRAQPLQFLPVRLTHASVGPSQAQLVVELPGSVTVRLPAGFAVEDLRRILSALGSGSGC